MRLVNYVLDHILAYMIISLITTALYFLASDGKREKNLKALLIKAIESLGSGTSRGILSSINKNLGGSYSIVIKDQVA